MMSSSGKKCVDCKKIIPKGDISNHPGEETYGRCGKCFTIGLINRTIDPTNPAQGRKGK